MSEERPNYSPSEASNPVRPQTYLVVTLGYSASVLTCDNLTLALERAKKLTARDGGERIVAATIARTSAGPRPVEVTMVADA